MNTTTFNNTPTRTAPATRQRAADWRDDAACRLEDPELFFPIGETGPAVVQAEEAKAVCSRCPVLATCRAWALTTGQPHGVFGGLTETERAAAHRWAARHTGRTLAEAADHVVAQRMKASRDITEYYRARVIPIEGGHSRWSLSSTGITVQGRNRTPRQVGFFLAHGREPVGRVGTSCGVTGCLTEEHLIDDVMRRDVTAEEVA